MATCPSENASLIPGLTQDAPASKTWHPSPIEPPGHPEHSRLKAQLSIELWMHILRSATEIPGIFDTSYTSTFSHPWGQRAVSQGWHSQKLYCDFLPTKRSIVLVCKLWHHIASPFLYEFISLHSMKQVHKLLFTAIQGQYELSCYVRRLDLSFESEGGDCGDDKEDLECLLDRVPSLEVYNADDMLEEWLSPLLSTEGPTIHENLRSVAITSGACHAWVQPSIIRRTFQRAPNLEIFRLLTTVQGDAPVTLKHAKLHTLFVHAELPDGWDDGMLLRLSPITWDLPRARHIGFCEDQRRIPRRIVDAPLAESRSFEGCFVLPNTKIPDRLPPLKLLTLRSDLQGPTGVLPTASDRKSVEHIGIEVTRIRCLARDFTELCNTRYYPSLKRVRLFLLSDCERIVDQSQFKDGWFVPSHHSTDIVKGFWHYWLTKLEARGVKVENEQGCPLCIPVPQASFDDDEYRRVWEAKGPASEYWHPLPTENTVDEGLSRSD